MTKAALAELPKGTWTASDYIDDDGISDEPVPMQVTVTITDDNFTVDFAGSAPATRGPVNMPFGSTLAMCKVVFKSLTSPERPSNAGQMRALSVKAEEGTLFHAIYPAPTFTLWTGIVGLELIHKALAQAMPERMAASSGGDVPGFMMIGIHPDTKQMFAISNNDPVGWGGTPTHDGANALIHLSESIVRNTPIEVLEARTTMLMERVETRRDSGGAERIRGGLGIHRDIRFLTAGEFLTVMKKTKSPPWALAGGLEPEPSGMTIWPGTDREIRVGMYRTTLESGERFVNRTADGGGYGPPLHRPPEAVVADVLDGYVTPASAENIYGTVVHSDGSWQPAPERIAATRTRPAPEPISDEKESR